MIVPKLAHHFQIFSKLIQNSNYSISKMNTSHSFASLAATASVAALIAGSAGAPVVAAAGCCLS